MRSRCLGVRRSSSQTGQLPADQLLDRAGGKAGFGPLGGQLLGGLDHQIAGRQHRERSLKGDQGAEEGRELRRQGDPEGEKQLQQVVEHGRAGRSAGAQMLGHEPCQRTFQLLVVETATQGRDLKDGLAEQAGIALLDGDQHLPHRRLLQGVQPAGGLEVDEPEPAALQHQDVSGCGSAWKHPSTSICFSAQRSSALASRARSNPMSWIVSPSRTLGPSSQSMTRTRAVDSSRWTTGTWTSLLPARPAAISVALRASWRSRAPRGAAPRTHRPARSRGTPHPRRYEPRPSGRAR